MGVARHRDTTPRYLPVHLGRLALQLRDLDLKRRCGICDGNLAVANRSCATIRTIVGKQAGRQAGRQAGHERAATHLELHVELVAHVVVHVPALAVPPRALRIRLDAEPVAIGLLVHLHELQYRERARIDCARSLDISKRARRVDLVAAGQHIPRSAP